MAQRGGEHAATTERLSIYDTSEPTVLLEPRVTRLEREIRALRHRLSTTSRRAQEHFAALSESLIEREKALGEQVAKIVPDRREEDVLPGAIYVGVATLTGSIIARNRNILLRVITPPTFLVVASLYFLPKTSENLSRSLERLVNKESHPTLHRLHQQVLERSHQIQDQTQQVTTTLAEKADRSLSQGASLLESSTGLKLREVFKKEDKETIKAHLTRTGLNEVIVKEKAPENVQDQRRV